MRSGPWLPVLLLLALGAYLFPQTGPAPAVPIPETRTLPNQLPAETKTLFEQARPAVVRVESLDPATREAGIGTGFFITDTGQVLTAYHVVSTGTLFRVNTLSGKTYSARVTAFDAASDVAILSVLNGGPFPYLKVTTRAPRPGETVLAIGNSDGDYLQPRRGQLLRLGAQAGRADFPQGTLEMTAPLAPGDSGGPVLDGNGQAIGVVSYILVDDNDITQRSYAVPVQEGGELLTALRRGERRDVPVVGMVFDPVHSGAAGGGVLSRVARGSPAERAGLRGSECDRSGNLTQLGDIITSVNGAATPDADAVITAVRRAKVGDTIDLEYRRDGQAFQTQVTLVGKATVRDLRDQPTSCGP